MAVTKKPNGKYEARYKDGGGNWRRKTFTKKSDADKFYSEATHARYNGYGLDEARAKQPFVIFAEEWYENQPRSDNYRLNVRSHLDNHILPAFGSQRISSITHMQVQGFVSESEGKLVPTSVRTMFSTARAIFKAAKRANVIINNPCDDIKLPKITKRKVAPATTEQVHAAMNQMPDRYRALVLLAAASGLRPGELFGVQVDDVDWTKGNGTIAIRRQIQSYTGAAQQVKETPKDREERIVVLSDEMLLILEDHLNRFPPEGGGFIFTNTEGRPLHRRVYNKSWQKARLAVAEEIRERAADNPIARAKANAQALFIEKLRFYDLRHYYASLLIGNGASPKLVQEMLGHSTSAMTMDNYTHLWPGDVEKARAATENLFKIN